MSLTKEQRAAMLLELLTQSVLGMSVEECIDAHERGMSPDEYKSTVARPDENGRCAVCGLEFEDPKLLTHECPPGFVAPPRTTI